MSLNTSSSHTYSMAHDGSDDILPRLGVKRHAPTQTPVTSSFTRSHLRTVMEFNCKGRSKLIDSLREAKSHANSAIQRSGGFDRIDLNSTEIVNVFKAHSALMKSRGKPSILHADTRSSKNAVHEDVDDEEITSSFLKQAKRVSTDQDASRMMATTPIVHNESNMILIQIQSRQASVMKEIFDLTSEWKSLDAAATTIKNMASTLPQSQC